VETASSRATRWMYRFEVPVVRRDGENYECHSVTGPGTLAERRIHDHEDAPEDSSCAWMQKSGALVLGLRGTAAALN